MNKLLMLSLLSITLKVSAQDTLKTSYPGTDQLWLKIFQQNEKVRETIYYASGKEWMSANYTDSETEKWNWFYENGNPFFEATIISNKLEGFYRIWYENGQLAEELTFKGNLENGMAVFYHPNGQVAINGEYDNGKMVGNWFFYTKEGEKAQGDWQWNFAALPESIRMQGSLKDGKPIGNWVYRTTAGNGTLEFKEHNHELN